MRYLNVGLGGAVRVPPNNTHVHVHVVCVAEYVHVCSYVIGWGLGFRARVTHSNFYKIRPIFTASSFYQIRA